MSGCKGVAKPECLPPNCSWADGQTRKYCRSKHNKAKTARARTPPSPSLPELLSPATMQKILDDENASREKTPRARHDLARTPRSPTPRSRTPTPKAKKARTPKAKSLKVKGVENWKVTKVEVWFPNEEDDDADNESVFNIATVIMTGPKNQTVNCDLKNQVYLLNDDYVDHHLQHNHKLNKIVDKETSLKLDSFKLDLNTDDIGSIHDASYGILKRGVKVTSKPKDIKQHLQSILQQMFV